MSVVVGEQRMELRGNELADGGVGQRGVLVGALYVEDGAARRRRTPPAHNFSFVPRSRSTNFFVHPPIARGLAGDNGIREGGRGGSNEARTGRAHTAREGQRVRGIFVLGGRGSVFGLDRQHDVVVVVFHEHVDVRANLIVDGAAGKGRGVGVRGCSSMCGGSLSMILNLSVHIVMVGLNVDDHGQREQTDGA